MMTIEGGLSISTSVDYSDRYVEIGGEILV